ncbi:hypothetical protein BC832DRAFT_542006 [Gaertneriomyces semiglobifer]|nr:hypothetical protein BC832DRAFT_542006 [Gaertneriomyces semiglobifer]
MDVVLCSALDLTRKRSSRALIVVNNSARGAITGTYYARNEYVSGNAQPNVWTSMSNWWWHHSGGCVNVDFRIGWQSNSRLRNDDNNLGHHMSGKCWRGLNLPSVRKRLEVVELLARLKNGRHWRSIQAGYILSPLDAVWIPDIRTHKAPTRAEADENLLATPARKKREHREIKEENEPTSKIEQNEDCFPVCLRVSMPQLLDLVHRDMVLARYRQILGACISRFAPGIWLPCEPTAVRHSPAHSENLGGVSFLQDVWILTERAVRASVGSAHNGLIYSSPEYEVLILSSIHSTDYKRWTVEAHVVAVVEQAILPLSRDELKQALLNAYKKIEEDVSRQKYVKNEAGSLFKIVDKLCAPAGAFTIILAQFEAECTSRLYNDAHIALLRNKYRQEEFADQFRPSKKIKLCNEGTVQEDAEPEDADSVDNTCHATSSAAETLNEEASASPTVPTLLRKIKRDIPSSLVAIAATLAVTQEKQYIDCRPTSPTFHLISDQALEECAAYIGSLADHLVQDATHDFLADFFSKEQTNTAWEAACHSPDR